MERGEGVRGDRDKMKKKYAKCDIFIYTQTHIYLYLQFTAHNNT